MVRTAVCVSTETLPLAHCRLGLLMQVRRGQCSCSRFSSRCRALGPTSWGQGQWAVEAGFLEKWSLCAGEASLLWLAAMADLVVSAWMASWHPRGRV